MKKVMVMLLALTSIASFASNRVDTSKVHAHVEATKPFTGQQRTILIAKTLNSAATAAINASKTNLIAKQTAMMIA